MTEASDIVDALQLAPHPEGGWFRETWRDDNTTAIYYLLAEGERSHWHRLDRVEIWHFYTGDPLRLEVSPDGITAEAVTLGSNFGARQRPQHAVPAGAWQSARTLGHWTLVGCTVAPPFHFARFELAPPDWRPAGR